MEYRYCPRPQNKNATYLTCGLSGASALMLALGMGNVAGTRTLWHFLFLFLLVAALFVFLRYLSSSYVYELTDAWGEPTLVISQMQGKRLSVHLRLGLAHLFRLDTVEDAKSEEGERAMCDFRAERVRYSFLATMGDVPTQILYGREEGVRFAVRIEGDAAFLAALREAMLRAEPFRVAEEEAEDAE